jgi:hypothetical protein
MRWRSPRVHRTGCDWQSGDPGGVCASARLGSTIRRAPPRQRHRVRPLGRSPRAGPRPRGSGAPPPAAMAAATCWYQPQSGAGAHQARSAGPASTAHRQVSRASPGYQVASAVPPSQCQGSQRLAALRVMAGRCALGQAPAASSRASASRFCRVRRNMDSHSTTPRIASASKVAWSVSAPHSAIAVNEGRRPAPRIPPGPGSQPAGDAPRDVREELADRLQARCIFVGVPVEFEISHRLLKCHMT